MAKRLGGIGEVIRIATERKIVEEDFRPVALGGPSNLHLDILMGRDTKIDIEDIYNGSTGRDVEPDFRYRVCECAVLQ